MLMEITSRRATLRSQHKKIPSEVQLCVKQLSTHALAKRNSLRATQFKRKIIEKDNQLGPDSGKTASVQREKKATVCERSDPNTKLLDPSPHVSEVVGRENERLAIHNFIHSAIQKRRSSSMYISGAPGTGKTAVVLCEAHEFEKLSNCRVVMVNCMHLRSATEVFSHLINSIESSSRSGKENQSQFTSSSSVEDNLSRFLNKKTLLLILDEVDQLESTSQDVLYRIFQWPETLTCHIVIIGIANALDLPERLPKLRSKEYQPQHLIFPPYTRTELTDIVSSRLLPKEGQSSNGVCFDPLAIQLCARKISASTGDVRTALDVCRRAIDLASQEALSRNENHDQSTESGSRPTLRHVSLALKELQVCHHPVESQTVNTTITNSNVQSPFMQRSGDLPLHHKLIIASAHLLRCQRKLREVSFSQLYEAYMRICSSRQLTGLEESELITVCGLLDSRGYLQYSPSKGGLNAKLGTPARFWRIKLRLDDRSVEQLLSDDMFSSILRILL